MVSFFHMLNVGSVQEQGSIRNRGRSRSRSRSRAGLGAETGAGLGPGLGPVAEAGARPGRLLKLSTIINLSAAEFKFDSCLFYWAAADLIRLQGQPNIQLAKFFGQQGLPNFQPAKFFFFFCSFLIYSITFALQFSQIASPAKFSASLFLSFILRVKNWFANYPASLTALTFWVVIE